MSQSDIYYSRHYTNCGFDRAGDSYASWFFISKKFIEYL